MKPIFVWLCATALLLVTEAEAQTYSLRGRVLDNKLEPVSYATVAVRNSTKGDITDINGNYHIELTSGTYEVVFSMIGYEPKKLFITIRDSGLTRNVILEEKTTQLQAARVTVKYHDASEDIIRQVIKNKDRWDQQKLEFSSKVYIKARSESEASRKKKEKEEKSRSRKNKDKDSTDPAPPPAEATEDLNLAEIIMDRHYGNNGKTRELILGKKMAGDPEDLFYLSTTQASFNFYNNLISVPSISETPFLSPISYSGLIAYKYKMLGSFVKDGQKYYRIKVSPKQLGNALVSGTLLIADSIWRIEGLEFEFPRYHMTRYDHFGIKMDFQWVKDTAFLPVRIEMSYGLKTLAARYEGNTTVVYADFNFHPNYPRNFFGNELATISQKAYDRDSSFWNTVRLEPLKPEELRKIQYTDSLREAHTRKEYLDSIDRDFNKVTFQKLFLFGQGHYNRDKGTRWLFKPLAFFYEPINIGGHRISYWTVFSKEYKNKKEIRINPNLNYGFLNRDLKGRIGFRYLYDPFTRSSVRGYVGRDFEWINPFDSYLNIFRRSNFFEKDYLAFYNSTEIFNGFYVEAGLSYENRKSIKDYKFTRLGDQIFNNNIPVSFNPYAAFYTHLDISYVPFQKYIREPLEKIVLGSRWPTFGVIYKKGVPRILNSEINFDYLEFYIDQNIRWGLLGTAKLRATSGRFLNTRNLKYVDYRFQRRGDPYFFSNPLYTFQLLDSSFATFKWYADFHYMHRFNGAILNKIPLLKKLNLAETAGFSVLYAPERNNLFYVEGYVGLEKTIRFWRERFRLGAFLVSAQGPHFGKPIQFKFTIEFYDREDDSWSY